MALSPCIVVTNDICVLITGAGVSIYEFVRTELLISVARMRRNDVSLFTQINLSVVSDS